jgi:hypothetical protein
MKLAIQIVAALVFLGGLVWFLQGINILPGSYMTGDPQWAINGMIAMIISGAVFFYVRRRK